MECCFCTATLQCLLIRSHCFPFCILEKLKLNVNNDDNINIILWSIYDDNVNLKVSS